MDDCKQVADEATCKIASIRPRQLTAVRIGEPREGRRPVPIEIEAYEAEDFATAIPGLDVEYVRTDGGNTPCRMTVAESDHAALSIGSMGFSATSRSEIPSDVGVFALITSAPFGGRYCGVDVSAGQLFFYAPATSFVGIETVGLEASFLTLPTMSLDRITEGLHDTVMPRSVNPLAPGHALELLTSLLMSAGAQPRQTLDSRRGEHLLEAAAGVLAVDATSATSARSAVRRRLGSRTIVRSSIDYVETTQTTLPTMGELCRAAGTSESRLRQAFIDVLEMPPTKYFQHRMLSRLRQELLLADPAESSVTRIAGSLGITELGRTAGRYKKVFGELPKTTLGRHFPHH